MKVTFEFNARTALRWALGALLVWASLAKIGNLAEFHGSLLAYQLPLPDALLRLSAMVLPWLELLCGFLMITRTARCAAVLWAVVLFAIFVLVTGQAWARGLDISCGCLKLDFLGDGAFAKFLESASFAFFRALLLLAASLYVLRSIPGDPDSAHK